MRVVEVIHSKYIRLLGAIVDNGHAERGEPRLGGGGRSFRRHLSRDAKTLRESWNSPAKN